MFITRVQDNPKDAEPFRNLRNWIWPCGHVASSRPDNLVHRSDQNKNCKRLKLRRAITTSSRTARQPHDSPYVTASLLFVSAPEQVISAIWQLWIWSWAYTCFFMKQQFAYEFVYEMFVNANVCANSQMEGLDKTTCVLCDVHRAETIGDSWSNKICRFFVLSCYRRFVRAYCVVYRCFCSWKTYLGNLRTFYLVWRV